MPTNRLRKIQRILIILSSVQISWECVKKCQKGKSSKRWDFTLFALFQNLCNATNRSRNKIWKWCTNIPRKSPNISERYRIQKWRFHHLGLISFCKKANDQTDRNKRNMNLFGPGVQTSQEGVQNTSSRSLDANMLA